MNSTLPDEARDLIDAVVGLGADLDLPAIWRRLLDSACRLTDAAHGVLAVLGADGEIGELVVQGMRVEELEALGNGPEVLGVTPGGRVPLRVDDLREHRQTRGLPPADPPVQSFLGVPVLVRDRVWASLHLANRRGGPFTEADQERVATLARAVVPAVENARVHQQGEEERSWQENALRLYANMTPVLRRQDTLGRLVEAVGEVTGADLVAVVQEADQALEIPALAGDREDVVALAEELRPLVLEVLRTGEVHTHDQPDGAGTLLVPLHTQVAPTGVLLATHPDGWDRLDGLHPDLLAIFSDQAGFALDLADSLAHRHQLLLTADRERISRDLHDLVIQRLFATGLHLQGARGLGRLDQVHRRIDTSIAELDKAISEIRTTIFQLNNQPSQTLREAARSIIAEYSPVLGFVPVLRFDGPVDLAVDSSTAEQVLATLREALSNVARHAHASTAYVELEAGREWLTLRVTDDGVGLPPDVDAEERRVGGLANARNRARLWGGRLEIRPAEPTGTRFEWTAPVAR